MFVEREVEFCTDIYTVARLDYIVQIFLANVVYNRFNQATC
jgi:hypothetical protein